MRITEDIAYKKITSVIFSCNTPKQVESAIKMIDNYHKKYDNFIRRNNLLNLVYIQLLGFQVRTFQEFCDGYNNFKMGVCMRDK
jgi:hypothetical protein